MKEKVTEQDWSVLERKARAALDESVGRLPESTQQRLAQARQLALASETPAKNASANWRAAGFGVAASLLAAGFFWFVTPDPSQRVEQSMASAPNSSGNISTATPGEGLWLAMEMTELGPETAAVVEDLEFMVWLDEEIAPDV